MSIGLSNFVAPALDFAGDLLKQDAAEGQQDHAQNFTRDMQNSAQAFNERMYKERYQMSTQDLLAAGLNPMLAYQHGPGSAPTSPAGSGTPGSTPSRSTTFTTGAVNAAQIQNIEADTGVKRAQEDNIRAQTPTHAVNINLMEQNIRESQQRINQSIQQIENLKAGERLTDAQINNYRELVPQIRATVTQLTEQAKLTKAQTHQTYTHSGLTAAQDEETRQRIKANLPAIQRALQELEEKARFLQMPQRGMDAAAHSSFLGALGAVGRALNPFNSLFK